MRCHYCEHELDWKRVRCPRCLMLGRWRRHVPGLGLLCVAMAIAAMMLIR
jgi:primosomal protein N'